MVVSTYIDQYLSNSRLSMSQFAERLGISKGHLSDIKNKKRNPSFSLSLKILKFCNAPVDVINKIAEDFKTNDSFYQEIKDKIEADMKVKAATEEVAHKLSNSMDLFNAYQDIISEVSIHKGELINRYGLSILDQLQYLVDRAFIAKADGVFSANEKQHTTFSGSNTFKMLSAAIKNEADQFDTKENKGVTRFYYSEVSNEGLDALNELKRRHHQEEAELMSRFTKAVKDGGKRVMTMGVSTCLHKLVPIFLCVILLSFGDHLIAGPGSGSGGTDPQGGNPSYRMRIGSGSYALDFKKTTTIHKIPVIKIFKAGKSTGFKKIFKSLFSKKK